MTLSRLCSFVVTLTICCGATAGAVQSPDFARDVLPIFESSCTVCHGAELRESQLRLDSEAAVMRGGLSGPALVPGDSETSLLIRRLVGTDEPAMPMGGESLSAEEIAKVGAWIDSVEPSAPVLPASTHWAYVSPVEPELPIVENSDWPRNPIDAFVLAALEKKEQIGRASCRERV